MGHQRLGSWGLLAFPDFLHDFGQFVNAIELGVIGKEISVYQFLTRVSLYLLLMPAVENHRSMTSDDIVKIRLLTNRWVVLLGVCILAGIRWFVMSSPLHFMGWMPSAWFRGEVLSVTRQSLNVAASWLFLAIIPGLFTFFLIDRSASIRTIMRDGFLLGKPTNCSKTVSLSITLLVIGAIVIGLIATASIPSLRDTYPIVRSAGNSLWMLIVSCSLTFGLILATEFFYRGIALSTLHKQFGSWAVYLLALVYVLDHVGAPIVELIGSGFVGILLGHLALRVKSLWPGFAIHVGCALTVDLSSLWCDVNLGIL